MIINFHFFCNIVLLEHDDLILCNYCVTFYENFE